MLHISVLHLIIMYVYSKGKIYKQMRHITQYPTFSAFFVHTCYDFLQERLVCHNTSTNTGICRYR
jgi:hypothetical protein